MPFWPNREGEETEMKANPSVQQAYFLRNGDPIRSASHEPERDSYATTIRYAQLLNPFDPAQLRFDQSYLRKTAAKRSLTKVPLLKPRPQEFFRVRPEKDYRMLVGVLTLEEDRERSLSITRKGNSRWRLTQSVKINGEPTQVRWQDANTLVLEPDDVPILHTQIDGPFRVFMCGHSGGRKSAYTVKRQPGGVMVSGFDGPIASKH
jgi:hypothetical protein